MSTTAPLQTSPATAQAAPCVPLGTGPVLSAAEATALSTRLKAIADPTRLTIVTFLMNAPDHEACTCELAPMVGLSEATVSHHLKTLARAGIVSKQRRGMNVYYRIHPASIHDLARTLGAGCC